MLSACGGKSSNKDQVNANNKPKSEFQHKVEECPALGGTYEQKDQDGGVETKEIIFDAAAVEKTLKVDGAVIPTVKVDGQAHEAKVKDNEGKDVAVSYIASCTKGAVQIEGFIPSSGQKVSTTTYMKQGADLKISYVKVANTAVFEKLPANSEEVWTAAAAQ